MYRYFHTIKSLFRNMHQCLYHYIDICIILISILTCISFTYLKIFISLSRYLSISHRSQNKKNSVLLEYHLCFKLVICGVVLLLSPQCSCNVYAL